MQPHRSPSCNLIPAALYPRMHLPLQPHASPHCIIVASRCSLLCILITAPIVSSSQSQCSLIAASFASSFQPHCIAAPDAASSQPHSIFLQPPLHNRCSPDAASFQPHYSLFPAPLQPRMQPHCNSKLIIRLGFVLQILDYRNACREYNGKCERP